MSFKLTERELAAALKGDASLLITQPEGETGSEIESVRRIKVSEFLAQLRDMHMLADTAAFVTGTVHGKPALISDGADSLPLKSLVVDIEPVQAGSGTPSPENVRAISGWTGATIKRYGSNALEPFEYEASGIKTDPQADGTMRAHGTTTRAGNVIAYKTVNIADSDFAIGDTFTLSCGANAGFSVRFLDSLDPLHEVSRSASASDGNSVTGSVPDGTVYLRFVCQFGTSQAEAQEVVDITTWFQIEHGSAFTGFNPYHSDVYEVDFPTEAGTVAAGTLNVTNGVLTVTRVLATYDGSETWSMNGSNTSGFICNAPAPIPKLNVNSSTSQLISNMFTIVGNGSVGSPTTTITGIPSGGGSASLFYIYLRYDFMADIAAWKAWLATHNMQVSYLIEPVTFQLSPIEVLTLLGANTIYADCGEVNATYRADPTLYATRGQTEDDMTADSPIANGKYFQIGNTLYKATAAIATGETIVPGTNCAVTSIAEALNLLNT